MDDIIKLLNLKDENVEILGLTEEGDTKTITLQKKLSEHHCPICGYKMHSRGVKTRIVNHPVLQDGYKLKIQIKQRRWLCTNLDCLYNISDQFNFVDKCRRTTNATELMIVNSFRDLSKSAAEIAREHNVSNRYALNVFEKYVDMRRAPLSEIISVDEVYFDLATTRKYVLVIQDFYTGEPIDLVTSRRKEYTEPYFRGISKKERDSVKFLISDMYNPYINYVNEYFHNALSVVDSFHVMKWILDKINVLLRQLTKEYKQKDEERFAKAEQEHKYSSVHMKISDESYLLQFHRWVLMKNEANIDYEYDGHINRHFGYSISPYKIEELFLAIHKDFPIIRDLKEEYVSFNKRNAGNPEQAAVEIDELIGLYLNSGIDMFVEFANTIQRFKPQIINSFIMAERLVNGKAKLSRLSNGPIESFNRKLKDVKRISRGYTNFNHLRNRILFGARNNAPIQG